MPSSYQKPYLRLYHYFDALQKADLLQGEESLSSAVASLPVDTLTYDTRTLQGNSLFLCKGAHFREEYLTFAAVNGAIAYVSEKKYSVGLPCILVKDIRAAMSLLAKLHFGAPDEQLVKIGITGTKGKSTTAYFVRSILDCYMADTGGKPCAILSSIENYDGKQLEESHLTTPEPVELFAHCAAAAESGVTHLVMEVSSQGLKYGRVRGITFDAAAFLNIGQDHISPVEHPNFEDYFASKLKIFDQCRAAVIAYDIAEREEILSRLGRRRELLTFGRNENADVYGHGIERHGSGYSFLARIDGVEHSFTIRLPGIFNVDNALAAIALCLPLKIPMKTVAKGLSYALVSGRMETFESRDRRVTVIVDYAHNKMSFEALFASVRQEFPGRSIVAVYGCPGGKAQGRRADLPAVSGKYAAHILITEEDSGEEPFPAIAADIAAHLAGKTDYRIIEDRGEAIREAILNFGQDSVVLITGKGEETRQKRGIYYVDCPSDVEYTQKYLAEYDRRTSMAALGSAAAED